LKALAAILPVLAAVGAMVAWPVASVTGVGGGPAVIAALAGLGVLGAAFALSWVVEAVEGDVPPFLGLTVLALVGLLPEYAVDATFAWDAATDPAQGAYVAANMTGGNRLLLGVGWPLVAIVGALRLRREVVAPRSARLGLGVLALAGAWMIVPVAAGRLALVDTAVLVALYGVLVAGAARGGRRQERARDDGSRRAGEGAPREIPAFAGPSPAPDDDDDDAPVVGPAAAIAALPAAWRWAVAGFGLFGAAATIFLAADPFASSLVSVGRAAGFDEFVLVQWVAPLASEAPEIVVALLLAWSGHPGRGLALLIASLVNQWTLLIGTMPLVTSIAAGELRSLPLDDRQRGELWLTLAVMAFGVVLVADRRLRGWGAAALVAVYVAVVALPDPTIRSWITAGACAAAVALLAASPARRRGVADIGRAIAGVAARSGASSGR
jgi:cation:H+ antiporter